MVNLRNNASKRKSDSFVIENAKAVRLANQPKRNVKIPISTQLKSLQEAHAALIKENGENVKLIENLKEQVAFHEQRTQSIVETESKESQTTENDEEVSGDGEVSDIVNKEEHIIRQHSLENPLVIFTYNLC